MAKRNLILKGNILADSLEQKCVIMLTEVVVEGTRLKLKTGVAWKLHMNVVLGTHARTYGACVYEKSSEEVPGGDQGTHTEVTH